MTDNRSAKQREFDRSIGVSDADAIAAQASRPGMFSYPAAEDEPEFSLAELQTRADEHLRTARTLLTGRPSPADKELGEAHLMLSKSLVERHHQLVALAGYGAAAAVAQSSSASDSAALALAKSQGLVDERSAEHRKFDRDHGISDTQYFEACVNHPGVFAR